MGLTNWWQIFTPRNITGQNYSQEVRLPERCCESILFNISFASLPFKGVLLEITFERDTVTVFQQNFESCLRFGLVILVNSLIVFFPDFEWAINIPGRQPTIVNQQSHEKCLRGACRILTGRSETKYWYVLNTCTILANIHIVNQSWQCQDFWDFLERPPLTLYYGHWWSGNRRKKQCCTGCMICNIGIGWKVLVGIVWPTNPMGSKNMLAITYQFKDDMIMMSRREELN